MKTLKEKVRKASMHFKERQSSSESPTHPDSNDGLADDFVEVQTDVESACFIEPETLQTLTQLIRQFSGISV